MLKFATDTKPWHFSSCETTIVPGDENKTTNPFLLAGQNDFASVRAI
jgi:hypothetical protein